MALFKPKTGDATGTPFFGVCEVAILGFEDKSGKFDWSPIMFDVIVRQKGSEYDRRLTIKGGLEKDKDGNIVGGSVLNKMYHLFDNLNSQIPLETQCSALEEASEHNLVQVHFQVLVQLLKHQQLLQALLHIKMVVLE